MGLDAAGMSEEGFLNPLRVLVERGYTRADELLRRYREDWKGFGPQKQSAVEKCSNHKLSMKLAAVEYQFDRARLTFFFTSESRVDFRALVRDLAAVYRTRIELRQIGARDEAKKVGGLGICGREVCCTTWMSQVKRVNLDHARVQSLSLNPTRLAGARGSLQCCILFEMQNYVGAIRGFAELNSKIMTTEGEGLVEKIDMLNDRIYLG